MVTAESKTENVIAARKAGVNNYIVKPFNAQTLKAKIEAVFRGPPESIQTVALVIANSARQSSLIPKSRIVWSRCSSHGAHHASARVTAFGATPAASKIVLRPERSGASRPPRASAWMPEMTNRQSTPNTGSAFEVGSDRIADRQHALERRHLAAAKGGGVAERRLIDRRMRLAAIEHLAAQRRIGVGQSRRRSRSARRRARRQCRDWRRP